MNDLQHARLLTGVAGAAFIVVFLASLTAWFVTNRDLYGWGALGSAIGVCGYGIGCWYLESRAKP
jgi:apolipoprotein N-acyltransferase